MKHHFVSRITVLLLLAATFGARASSTVSAPFTGTPIAAGNKIWFTAEVKITGTASYPLTIYFTDQSIHSPAFSLTVPDAILVLDPAVTTATTIFNGTNWVTYARPSESGYYFLSGYNHNVTSAIPGSLSPVSWTGTFKASRPGVSVLWHMAAAVYTSLSSDLNSLGVKPSDCNSCSSYPNSHSAGSPEHYLSYVISGARGGGGNNYTGGESGADHETPDAVGCTISLCAGSTATVTVPAATGSWSSSNSSVATVSGGVITGVSAGTARISYTLAGCPVWQTTTVTVNALPSLSASGPSGAICAGGAFTLHASGSGGSCGGCGSTGHCGSGSSGGCGSGGSGGSGGSCGGGSSSSYAWSGPGGFTSAIQNPTRSSSTTTMSGVYSVTYTDAHGCSRTTTTNVAVNKLPTSVTASVSPVPACAGNTIYLNGTVTGGGGYTLLWTGGSSAIVNSNTTNASITSAATTDAGTYTLTAVAPGCSGNVRGTATLPAVRKLPTTLTAGVSPNPVCQGSSLTLSATSSGSVGTITYAWSGPSGAATIVNPASLTAASVSSTNAASAGVYTLTASAEGCGSRTAYTSALVVNKLPAISAAVSPATVCAGGSFSLTGTVTGGNGYTLLWTGGTGAITNNTTANAYVASAVSGNAGGYTLTATAPGCGSTSTNTNSTPVVVSAAPTSTGATNNGPVCAGGTVTLSAHSTNATAWSWTGPGGFSSSLQNPTVMPSATGTYSLVLGNPGSGCSSATVYTTTVTVNAGPSSTGATNSGPVCAGSSATLHANSSGATAWSWTGPGGFASSLQNPTVAPTATSTYSLTVSNPGTGCSASTVYTTTVAVNPMPSSTGATNSGAVCAGNSVTLHANSSNATAWSWTGPDSFTSSLQDPVITPGSTGTYSLSVSNAGTGCSQAAVYTTLVTVTPLPSVSAGSNTAICAGSSAALSASGAATYSWAPSTGLSSAGGANVTAHPAATTTYTVTGSTGGCSNTATVQVSVNAIPDINAGSGATICSGSSTTLTATGGTTYSWAPATGLSATAGSTVSASPAATTTYTITGTSNGCSSTATVSVVVNPLPDAGSIAGPGAVCVGSSVTMADCAMAGSGTWTSSTPSVATISSGGVVTGVSAGTTTISYTVTTACGTATATKVISVNAISASLTGPSSVDIGSNVLLSVSGGSWSSSNSSIATVDSTGTVTGVNGGTATISYTMTNSCFSFTVTKPISVNAVSIMPITGGLTVCAGNTTTLADATTGGSWSSGNAAVATVSSTGVVTGVSAGTAVISYSLASSVVTAVVTVNGLPSAISGAFNLCAGMTATLSDADPDGTWSISPTSVATIDGSTGVVTPVAAGTAIATYTLSTGCFTTAVLTVNASVGAIGGSLTVCTGATTTLTETTMGGTWTSSNTAAVAVSTTGTVTGVAAGNATISYTSASGCYATAEVSVTPVPVITGTLTVCQGSPTSLSGSPDGGTWTSSNSAVATVSTTGVVSGIAAGTARITYTTGASCSTSAVATVLALQPISGASVICVGTTATLTDPTTGGTWSSSNTSIATVGSTNGVVTGVSEGSATITYRLSNGCMRTASVNVTVLTPITGTMQACVGLTTTLSNATPGGTWSGAPGTIVSIGSTTGIITGVAVGTANITYTVGSCKATGVLTVVASPSPITGPSAVCTGSTVTVNDVTTGGTWSTAATNVTLSGTETTALSVSGITAGVATVTYTAGSFGCYRTYNISVGAPPAAIAGTFTVCPGGTAAVTDATSGGTWSSSNPSVVTVSLTTGFLTGISTGTAFITYTTGAGCAVSTTVTVIASPEAIVGPGNVCTGSAITLSSPSGAGTWNSSNNAQATVGATTGIVTGVSAGTPNITFTLAATGCKVKTSVTVTAIPNAGTLSGPTVVAVGGTITLTSTGTPGGAWSSSGAEATVSSSGVVTGVSAGSVTITYAATNECGYSGAYKPISIAAARGIPTGGGSTAPSIRTHSGADAGSAAGVRNGTGALTSSPTMVVGDRIATGSAMTPTSAGAPATALRQNAGLAATPVLSPAANEVRIVPNPNNGTFTIQGAVGTMNTGTVEVEIRTMTGQLVYRNTVMPKNGIINEQVQLNNGMANGMYTLCIKGNAEQKMSHFVMER